MKSVSNVLTRIYAYGIVVCLFAGGISLLGYIAALIIGGETATALCAWVFKSYLPWVIKFTSIFAGIGLVGMYLSKQKALTAKVEKD
ncbi:MAG: hypothetical protein IJB78_04460 [Oscillospiraceae bacterium]|nr:hypothetical protein [Oscillospiraceae bacterium]